MIILLYFIGENKIKSSKFHYFFHDFATFQMYIKPCIKNCCEGYVTYSMEWIEYSIAFTVLLSIISFSGDTVGQLLIIPVIAFFGN